MECVRHLARAADKFPQSMYMAFTMSLQNEWKFLQRLIPGSSAWFGELNDVTKREFIPALLARRQFSEAEMELFELPIRWGGLGILDPTTKAAKSSYELSFSATSMVREAILGDEPLDVPGHRAYYAGQQRKRRAEGEAELKARYEGVLCKLRPEQRQKVQGQVDSKGISWMSVVSRAKESFDLSAQQWRDQVHLQYGWDLQGLPERCDGCGKRFSTDHALICMKGGLVG